MGSSLPYAASHRFSKLPRGSLTYFLILSLSQSPEVENLPTTLTRKLRPQSPEDGGENDSEIGPPGGTQEHNRPPKWGGGLSLPGYTLHRGDGRVLRLDPCSWGALVQFDLTFIKDQLA